MSDRNPFQHTLRGILAFLSIFIPLIWPVALPVTVVAFCSLLAYDGLNRRDLTWGTLLLIVLELVGGLELGVLALPFLLAGLFLGCAGRIMAVPPWAGMDGWHLGDLLRTVLVATALAIAMTAGSVFVAAVGYGFRMPLERLILELTPRLITMMAATASVMVVVLRRIDVPFRRPIRFGI